MNGANDYISTNAIDGMQPTDSLATGQRSLGDSEVRYPLWPPQTRGCPKTSTDEVQYPLEVDYDYDAVDPEVFEQAPLPCIKRWGQLLPPLGDDLDLDEGGTALVSADELVEDLGLDYEVYLKDESRNPTWSHKDRLNRCTVGAALGVDAPGVVVSSSGNHGASAAAYAANASLPCVILTSTVDVPENIVRFLRSYGTAVLAVSREQRWPIMREIVERLGYHPVSNFTEMHTGHPFGPEGYKTIAYETYRQLGGRAPGTVIVPTGYAELLYGVWKGFNELRELDVADRAPRMIACEPAARAPLSKAIKAGKPAVAVDATPTEAYSIRATVSGYRGVRAIQESNGFVSTLSDEALVAARERLATQAGLWLETAGAASLAGLRDAGKHGEDLLEPVICLATSSGLKNRDDRYTEIPMIDSPEWERVAATLRDEYGLSVNGA